MSIGPLDQLKNKDSKIDNKSIVELFGFKGENIMSKKISVQWLVGLGEDPKFVSKFIGVFGIECKVNERSTRKLLDMCGRHDVVDLFVKFLNDPKVMHRLAEYLGIRYEPTALDDTVKTQIHSKLCRSNMDDRLPLALVEMAEWSESFEDCR
jgi:hypothetical protein